MASYIAFKFQSLTRDSNHSNYTIHGANSWPTCFNPSRGIAIIQTGLLLVIWQLLTLFQSLTRDSNHSNPRKSAF